MKIRIVPFALAVAIAAALAGPAQAEQFSYHGSLSTATGPASGSHDLRLTLYSAESGGRVLAGPVNLYGVEVRDGSFSTSVDFGAAAGAGGWLAVAVRAGNGEWETLEGRSAVEPAASSCPGSWALDGNAGNPSGSYLGTADTEEVRIKQNSSTAIWLRGGAAVELSPYLGAVTPGPSATSIGFSSGAAGAFSFAGGFNSLANHAGSFVWGDRNSSGLFQDSASDQFIVGAKGGVGINTANATDGTSPLDRTLTLAPRDGQAGVSFAMRNAGGAEWYFTHLIDAMLFSYRKGGTSNMAIMFGANNSIGLLGAISSAAQPFKVGTNASTGNGAYLSPGGTWTNASSRFFKQDFASIDAGEVLSKLAAMPIQTWSYLNGTLDGRHLGPVAEDFATAFGLGNDSQHISTVDANGVALVAIQGLNSKVDSRVGQLEAENAALRTRLDELAAQVERLSNRAE